MTPEAPHAAEHTAHGAAHPAVGHVVPVSVLAGVLAVLLALTFITVAVTWFDLGAWNIWIALGIATIKAGLVALYFMHLRYDKPFNGVVLITSLAFVMLFIGFALLDTREYRPNIESFREAVPGGDAPLIHRGQE